jgi:hypothetical protein
VQSENYVTSGSANTEISFMFITPGATRAVALLAFRVQGKGAGLTALSGIAFRIKQWTSTAATGGTSLSPAPVDNRAPAAVASINGGTSGGTAAITNGTGGPVLVGWCGCGASGPGGWVAINPDAGIVLDGGATKSTVVNSSSGTTSLNFEFAGEICE